MALRMLFRQTAATAPRLCGPARMGSQLRWCATSGQQQQQQQQQQADNGQPEEVQQANPQGQKVERPEGSEEAQQQQQPEQGGEGEYGADEDLTQEIEKLEGEVEKYKELWLRAEADQEQIKTVAQKDVINARRFGCQDLAKALLRPLDNFDRVLNEFDSSAKQDEDLVEGLRMVQSGFLKSLDHSGISKIDVTPFETEFDPNVHEAVKMIPADEGVGSNVVAEELAAGYRYHERVLRATVVIVTE